MRAQARRGRRNLLLVLPAGFLLATGLAADGYDAGWNAVTGGGPAVNGNGYALVGAVGQPAAGVQGKAGYVVASGVLVAFSSSAPPVETPEPTETLSPTVTPTTTVTPTITITPPDGQDTFLPFLQR